ncbi:hypothetical protein [Pseudarthrobacter sp. SORGH_AS 212]|uniref:hypothetical protein n=1 Tax=Pseudarthrobacter sp. SORGH_AS 212 TaxID=3041777 RepID=UPI0032B876B4
MVAINAVDTAAEVNANIHQLPLSTLELLRRGFKPARTADFEDIVLKAPPADGSVRCRASTEGLIQLLIDNSLVWSRQYDPKDTDTALWLEAARTRDVTILCCSPHAPHAGDSHNSNSEPVMMAKVPTEWTR